MKSIRLFVLALLLAMGAMSPARAATFNVDYVDASDGAPARFQPDYFVARAGDVVHFDLRTQGGTPGLCDTGCPTNAVQFAGTGTYFHSNGAAELDTTFQGGVVWFHNGDATSLSRGGACVSVCGGFTDRPNAPAAPVVSQPAEGAMLVRRDVTVSGTSEPWTVVSLRLDGGAITPAMANGSGAWTIQLNSLSRSAHRAEITAIDAAARRSPTQTLNFAIGGEARPPTVEIENADPYVTLDKPVYKGVAGDDSGVASIEMTIGGDLNRIYRATCSPACPAGSVAWQIELPDRTTFSGVRLKVEDVYGNIVLRDLTLMAVRQT